MFLTDALAPFLRLADFYRGRHEDDADVVKTVVRSSGRADHLTAGDFRRLREQVDRAMLEPTEAGS